jgi:predicted signal transduction protein with EAL and GGDEF domain
MIDLTGTLQEFASLATAALAAFAAFALVDPALPTSRRPRWGRRLACALSLCGATVALMVALSSSAPGAVPLLILLAGATASVVAIDQRQRSDLFYAAACLPFALAASFTLSTASGLGPIDLGLLSSPSYWFALVCLLTGASSAFVVAAHFRRRRSGSPLQLTIAAALLLAGGLFCHAQVGRGAGNTVTDATVLPWLVAMALVAAALSLWLAAPRWRVEREGRDGMRRSSRTDPVSGLPVLDVIAESFVRVLRLAVAVRGGCAVVVLQFGALERVLSTQGKAERDRLYAAAAWRLRSARRDEELIAAMGEQRFLLVLRVADAAQTTARVRELLAMFEQPLGDGESKVRLRPSAGISLWPDHGDDFPRLLANALVALERCPPGGLQLFHVAQREENEQRLQVETSLGRALSDGEIGLVLQPIIDALSGEVRMVELLARWNHPELGSISPRQFILVAESSGAIAEFDRWLLREALSTTKWLDAAGFPQIRVALNCSPVNLVDATFLDDFERAVLDSGVEPARLEVEVTEAALAEGERAVVESLVRLRSLGVGLTIDDFGIGHSSLARLRDLPIDTLKIDQSFVRDMDHPQGEFLVSGILGLAHGLGKAVIAEGVETRAQRSALTDFGCEYLQGFLISRPLSWRALLDFLGADTGTPPADPSLQRAASTSDTVEKS